jgi:hypothetical protein
MYQVTCECTKTHSVTLADAGASLPCGCGRRVEVPALHRLRLLAGESVFSPDVRIRALLHENRLPGTDKCACCGQRTDTLAQVWIQYEWEMRKHTNRWHNVAGCLTLAFLGFGWFKSSSETTVQGSDQTVVVPVCVCNGCRHKLEDKSWLREALCKTPDYADLLDRYPEARITLGG